MNNEQASNEGALALSNPRDGGKLTVSQMNVADVVSQVETIRAIMDAVMVEGTHYGKIPGTNSDKPTLLLPGAQKLGMTFRFRVSYPVIERTDIPNHSGEGGEERPPHREYEITARIEDGAGNFMGEGIGLCSTLESKYRFRNHENYEATEHPVPQSYWKLKDNRDRQRTLAQIMDDVSTVYGTKKLNGQWFIVKILGTEKVEYPNPADYYNTVKKIAKKRAYVDAILTVTAAGDLFTQDLEDLDANRTALAEETGKQWDEAPEGKTEPAAAKKETKTEEKKKNAETYTAPEDWKENFVHFKSSLKDRKLGTLEPEELILLRDKWIADAKFWKNPSEQDEALKKSVLQGLSATVDAIIAAEEKAEPLAPASNGTGYEALKYATQITDYLAENGIPESRYFEVLRENRQIPDEGAHWKKIDDVDSAEWLKHAAITLPHLMKLDEKLNEAREKQRTAAQAEKTAAPASDMLPGLGDRLPDAAPEPASEAPAPKEQAPETAPPKEKRARKPRKGEK